jgi:hypothetical protein
MNEWMRDKLLLFQRPSRVLHSVLTKARTTYSYSHLSIFPVAWRWQSIAHPNRETYSPSCAGCCRLLLTWHTTYDASSNIILTWGGCPISSCVRITWTIQMAKSIRKFNILLPSSATWSVHHCETPQPADPFQVRTCICYMLTSSLFDKKVCWTCGPTTPVPLWKQSLFKTIWLNYETDECRNCSPFQHLSIAALPCST